MKNILIIFFLLILNTFCLAQSPIIGFTKNQIKAMFPVGPHKAQLKWETTFEEELWYLSTKFSPGGIPEIDEVHIFYVFNYGQTTNHEVIQIIKAEFVYLLYIKALLEDDYVQIADNKFYKSGLIAECEEDKSESVFSIRYFKTGIDPSRRE